MQIIQCKMFIPLISFHILFSTVFSHTPELWVSRAVSVSVITMLQCEHLSNLYSALSKRFISSPKGPEQYWGQPGLICSG